MGASVGNASNATSARTETGLSSSDRSLASSARTFPNGTLEIEKCVPMTPLDGTDAEYRQFSSVHSDRGFNWFIASVIIVADMVGGGLVAMPAGFQDTGSAYQYPPFTVKYRLNIE